MGRGRGLCAPTKVLENSSSVEFHQSAPESSITSTGTVDHLLGIEDLDHLLGVSHIHRHSVNLVLVLVLALVPGLRGLEPGPVVPLAEQDRSGVRTTCLEPCSPSRDRGLRVPVS